MPKKVTECTHSDIHLFLLSLTYPPRLFKLPVINTKFRNSHCDNSYITKSFLEMIASEAMLFGGKMISLDLEPPTTSNNMASAAIICKMEDAGHSSDHITYCEEEWRGLAGA